MNAQKKIVIIGGGASGIFTAALCAEKIPNSSILVLEKTKQLLAKVRISGGGRCNVTHAEFDPKLLTGFYPRGHKELLGPFHRFQPKDTIAWFQAKGVSLKTEEDGRMFPQTDCSETIIDCLLHAAQSKGVEIQCGMNIQSIEKRGDKFYLFPQNIECDILILATGSSPQGHTLAASLGHTITPPVPSLFTFNVPTSPLLDLSGITLSDAQISLEGTDFKQRGPLLLTHFGFSGPCALKLSAWAARYLNACHYKTNLVLNWIPAFTEKDALATLLSLKTKTPLKTLSNQNCFSLPAQLWKRLLTLSEIPENTPLNHIPHSKLQVLAKRLTKDTYLIEGKTAYKHEFVTCGGVSLKEIDFKTMQSRLVDSLFFVGEILDIDGVTGGFNFQNAWTTAFLAADALERSDL